MVDELGEKLSMMISKVMDIDQLLQLEGDNPQTNTRIHELIVDMKRGFSN